MKENFPELTDEYCLQEFGWKKTQFEVIKNSYFKGLSFEDIKVFSHICKHTKLDPFLKQIYAIPRGGKMTVQTSIDGYRMIAERSGRYSPGREPVYTYDKNGVLISSTAYVKKMTNDGTWHEVGATAYFSEYSPGKNTFWAKMPHVMIAKCAEALALRKAFPGELSGTYTDDEMIQADQDKVYDKMEETIVAPTVPLNTNSEEEFISNEQVINLLTLESKCDKVCVENGKKYMKEKFNVNEYSKLNKSQYIKVVYGYEYHLKIKENNNADIIS